MSFKNYTNIHSRLNFRRYPGKTIAEIYRGWETPESLKVNDFIIRKQVELLSGTGNIEYAIENYHAIKNLLECNNIEFCEGQLMISPVTNVDEDILQIVSQYYISDSDESSILKLAFKNRKWDEDIFDYNINVEFNSRREHYERDSEFLIGDGDPFYIRWRMQHLSLKMSLEHILELNSSNILKFEGVEFKLNKIESLYENGVSINRHFYKIIPQIYFIKKENFLPMA